MSAELKAVHPVLPSQDVKASIRFYEQLGFQLKGLDSRTDPGYAVIVRDEVELHLQWHDPSEWSVVERPSLRIIVSSVEELFQEYAESGAFHEETAIRETPWGTREFAFFDPSSNGLTFYQDL